MYPTKAPGDQRSSPFPWSRNAYNSNELNEREQGTAKISKVTCRVGCRQRLWQDLSEPQDRETYPSQIEDSLLKAARNMS
jgi:hypothetical protein